MAWRLTAHSSAASIRIFFIDNNCVIVFLTLQGREFNRSKTLPRIAPREFLSLLFLVRPEGDSTNGALLSMPGSGCFHRLDPLMSILFSMQKRRICNAGASLDAVCGAGGRGAVVEARVMERSLPTMQLTRSPLFQRGRVALLMSIFLTSSVSSPPLKVMLWSRSSVMVGCFPYL